MSDTKTTENIMPPLEFTDKMHDWMAEHTGGNTLGHETIARLAWKYFMDRQYFVNDENEYRGKHHARKV